MTVAIIISVASAGLCGVLAVRRVRRFVPVAPSCVMLPARHPVPLSYSFEDRNHVRRVARFHAFPALSAALFERLRQEELRQRPWEGRN